MEGNARELRQGDPYAIHTREVVMEMLQCLFMKAAAFGVLAPPANHVIQHQCSLYADDVMFFVSPAALLPKTGSPLRRSCLTLFGEASGLHTNLQKSLIAQIA